jgi:hypothetical protein
MLKPVKYVWRRIWRFASLVHGYDDVRETYGDNPNNLPEEERLMLRGAASNVVGGSSTWGGF